MKCTLDTRVAINASLLGGRPTDEAPAKLNTHLTDGLVRRQRKRALVAAGVGTFVEFFDYASYAYLATAIAAVFFPEGDRKIALIQTFALFAASFAMRPIGALFWSHFGDRIGRKRTLSLTIIGVGVATFAIGLLPGYTEIGINAALLLVVVRLFQSFCTAGEYSGAAVLIGEFAPAAKRGQYVSVVPISCAAGFLLASGLASWLHGSLSRGEMLTWGWRIPFLLGGAITILGWRMRRLLQETPEFVRVVAEKAVTIAPVQTAVLQYPLLMLRLFCVMGVNAAGYYLVLGYMATYLEIEVGLSPSHAEFITTVALLAYLPLLYAFATLSDRVGRRSVLLMSSILFVILSYPVFSALQAGSFVMSLMAQVLLVAVLSLNDACFATYFVESFPARVRFSGFALPFNIGVAVFGGTAPLLSTWLIQRTGNTLMPALIMMSVAVLSLPALLFAPDANNKG